MKRVFSILMVTSGLLVLQAGLARADPFTLIFCPGDATCPSGIDATLGFDDTDLTYDYLVTLTFIGDATAPWYIDEVQFDDGIAGDDYLTPTPTLISAPVVTGGWETHVDNLSGSANSCDSDNPNKKSVCSGSPSSFGAVINNATATFVYGLNLDGVPLPTIGSGWNLRAQFLNQDGSNAGILSPDGNFTVPEPSTLLLFGTGLALVGVRYRRRKG